MAGIFGQGLDDDCSQGVGDKLAALWKELRRSVLSLVGVDDELEEHELTEQSELGEYEAFDDGRASIAPRSTPHGQRSRYRRAYEAPRSPMPTALAEFD
jgi:hypothetical protein